MNATPTAGPQRGDLPQRWAPPSPGLALGLGIVLVFLGAWTLTENCLSLWAGRVSSPVRHSSSRVLSPRVLHGASTFTLSAERTLMPRSPRAHADER